jgi:hypothetical protein
MTRSLALVLGLRRVKQLWGGVPELLRDSSVEMLVERIVVKDAETCFTED